jgi:predicted nucleic acid-binding protein
MEMICLDTNVLIAHKRAKKADKHKTWLFRLATKSYRFAVSSITVYELLRGDNLTEDAYWKAMFNNITVLDFDSACAECAAKIYLDLKVRGLLIEAEDLLIAATAVRHQIKLATGNTKHFARVENLALITDNEPV